MLLFLCYPRCSTCKRAMSWLDDKGIAYTFRDIKEDHPSEEELAAWHQKSGLSLRRFYNTSGLLYRSLELRDKLPDMREQEQLKLLASDGMLVKRPVLVGNDFVLVGFREQEWQDKLIT